MFYTEGHFYKVFNKDRGTHKYKLLKNHNEFLVFHNLTIQKSDIAEDDEFSMALEKANENELLWVVESIDPQTPPRKTPRSRAHSRRRKAKKTHKRK